MLDCGSNLERGWFPSIAYAGAFIETLLLQNLDEDHVKDLPHVWDRVRIGSLCSNPSVTSNALAAMKREFGMHRGVTMAHAILRHYGPGLVGTPANFGDVTAWAWSNRYGMDFVNTNDLSLATFIRWGTFTILFSGDLETAGWRALLRNPGFVADLCTVTVLVASHHGRANGRCDEVFNIVRPDIVIFSDDRKQYKSQETDAWYRQRVSGIPVLGSKPPELMPRMRHVLTTRRDGSLTIQVNRFGRYLVSPSRNDSPQVSGLASLFGDAA